MKYEATPKGDNITNGNSYVTETESPIKMELVIETLLRAGRYGVTQPEAYPIYRESCLNSSISALQNNHCINISRQSDITSKVHRKQKPFTRYWLPDEAQANKALNLLNYYRRQRNAPPLKLGDIYQPTNKPV